MYYERVKAYMEENRMIEPGSTVLAGVSGGGDSMAMLALLVRYQKEVPFTLAVIHVNHGIRGEEAGRDQAAVEEACRRRRIPCQVCRFPVPLLAAQWKVGLEEAGRTVRREAFDRERLRLEAEGAKVRIALAHNRDDLAETMLHHLARGSGLRGLSSMRPVSDGMIRPVLCLGKEEIVHYLEENGIPYMLDSTNLSDAYTRNRIRHHILPLMEQEINVRAAAHMAETSRVIAQAEDYLSRQGQALLKRYRDGEGYLLDSSFFKEEAVVQAYAVQEAFEALAGKRKDFTSLHVRRILEMANGRMGGQLMLPYGLLAEKTYPGVRLWKKSPKDREESREKAEASGREWEIPLPGTLTCPLGTFRAEIFSYQGQKIEEKKCTKWLDYDKIKCRLCVRTRKAGDFLVVNKEGNRKKLNRLMIDEKMPRERRDSLPLAACESEVLWMAGGRMNERYKITPQTKRVLELSYQGGNSDE